MEVSGSLEAVIEVWGQWEAGGVAGATGGWRGRLEAVEGYLYANQIIYMEAGDFDAVESGWRQLEGVGDCGGPLETEEGRWRRWRLYIY